MLQFYAQKRNKNENLNIHGLLLHESVGQFVII